MMTQPECEYVKHHWIDLTHSRAQDFEALWKHCVTAVLSCLQTDLPETVLQVGVTVIFLVTLLIFD